MPAMASAVANSRSRTAAGSVPYDVVQISASTPATWGVAMDVPLKLAYSEPPLTSGLIVDRIETPGAATSTSRPTFEKLARPSVRVVAATPITFWQLAGASAPSLLPSLPAAATSTAPLLHA